MKTIHGLALALAAIAIHSGCDSNWGAEQVPEAVQQQFAVHYPTIKQVEWEKSDSLYEAEFKISGRERVVWFSEDGNLVRYTEEIEEQYLPAAVLEQLQAQYDNYQVDEVHRVQEDGQTNFWVELEHKRQDVKLLFSESGELLQTKGHRQGAVKLQSASLLPTPGSVGAASDLGMAEAQWELPAILREVSGIAMLPDGLLACVQDEEGKIYLYDLDERKIVEEIPFGDPGDYEGIAVAGKTAYVLRSDGAIFEIEDFRGEAPKTSTHKTAFPTTINMEGLAYDAAGDRLLLASKGYDTKLGNRKGIYAFSLSEKRAQTDPTITIALDQVSTPKSTKKKKSGYEVLQPSSLELHPSSGELYLLDAVNNRLYLLNAEGTISKTVELDKKLLRQAEGLTFGQDGALYIASEGGKKGNGMLLKYSNGL